MNMLCPNLCYNEVCYKGTALFIVVTIMSERFFTIFVEQAFGVGGESAYNTKQLEKTKKIEDMKKVEDRLIKVVFLADVAATMKWDFRPQQNQVQVNFAYWGNFA